jgi:hypothetical protein
MAARSSELVADGAEQAAPVGDVGILLDSDRRRPVDHADDPVPPEYPMAPPALHCCRQADVVMVGWPSAAQDRLSADVPPTSPRNGSSAGLSSAPHQRERAGRIESQVSTGGRVLEPHGVIMPSAPRRPHPVDLLLCGHHYRLSPESPGHSGRPAAAVVQDQSAVQPRWEVWVFSPLHVGCHPVKVGGAVHQCFQAAGGDDGNDCRPGAGRLVCHLPGNCIRACCG